MLPQIKPQRFSDILNHAFDVYLPIWKKTYPVLLLYLVATVTTSILIDNNFIDAFMTYIFSYAILLSTNTIILNETLSWKKILKTLVKRFFPFLLLLICLFFIMAVVVILFSLILAALFYPLSLLIPDSYMQMIFSLHPSKALLMTVLISLASIIIFITTIYLYFIDYVFWIENKSIIKSITEGYQLVKNKWLYTLKNLFLYVVVISLPCLILVFETIYLIINAVAGAPGKFYANLLGAIILIVYFPLMQAIKLFIFYALKSFRQTNSELSTGKNT